MTEAQTGLVGVALGALITGAVSLLSLLVQQRLGKDQDARNLRDAKRGRLGADYVELLHAGGAIQRSVHELHFVLSNETVEERDNRLSKMVGDAVADINRVRIRLRLEGENPAVDLFDKLLVAATQYRSGLAVNAQHHGTVTLTEFNRLGEDVSRALESLGAAAESRLSQLEEGL